MRLTQFIRMIPVRSEPNFLVVKIRNDQLMRLPRKIIRKRA